MPGAESKSPSKGIMNLALNRVFCSKNDVVLVLRVEEMKSITLARKALPRYLGVRCLRDAGFSTFPIDDGISHGVADRARDIRVHFIRDRWFPSGGQTKTNSKDYLGILPARTSAAMRTYLPV